MKEKLKNKIMNFDLHFDRNEESLICFDVELSDLLIKILELDYRVWNEDVLHFIRDEWESDLYTDDPRFMLNYYKACIWFDDLFIPSTLTEYKEMDYVASSHFDELLAVANKKLYSGNYKYPRKHMVVEDLVYLLDTKQYKSIEEATSIVLEKKDLMVFIKLMNEYPWDKYEFPIGLIDSPDYLSSIMTRHYDKLSYNAILRIIKTSEKYFTPEVKMRLYQLITSLDYPWTGCIYKVGDFYKFIVNNYNDAQIHNILLSIYKKGDLSWIEYVLKRGVRIKGEIGPEVNEQIKKGNKLTVKTLSAVSKNNPFILENSEVCHTLIDNAEIKPIIESKEASKYIGIIIEKINNEDPVYMEKINSFDFPSSRFPKLVEAILNCKHTKKIYVDDSFLLVEESKKIIENFFKSDSSIELMPNDEYGTFLDPIFSKVLLKAGKYDLFLDTFRIMEVNPSLQREIERQVLKSEEFYRKLALKDVELLINNKDLINYYVQRKEFIPVVNDLFRPYFSILKYLTEESVNVFLEYVCEHFNLNYKHALRLKNKFGNDIIKYIHSQKINEILSLDDDRFNKLMSLFETKEYNFIDIAASYDNIKQKEFEVQNSDIMNIFVKLKYQLENDCLSGDVVYEVIKNLDEQFFDKHPEINKKFKEDPRTFAIVVFNSYRNTRSSNSLELLREIANHYIAKKRESYHETYNLSQDVALEKSYDEKSYKSALFRYFVTKNPPLPKKGVVFNNELKARLREKGLSVDLIDDLFVFYNDKKAELRNIQSVVARELYSFRAIGEQIIEEYYSKEALNNYRIVIMKEYADRIKFKWVPGKAGLDMYSVLSSLRMDHLNALLDDEESFKALKELFQKRKLHLVPKGLQNFVNKNDIIDLRYDESTLATFISYFRQIREKKSGDNISLYDVINMAKAFSQTSSVYAQILTADDALLISANEGSTSASKKTNGTIRLDESVEYTKNNYLRNGVTVPTFNKVYNVNGKQLRVVLGNYTNPCNVSFGERDDSCMRIGGTAEGLYNLCLTNINGFHVRFEDAKTGRYVSRVSGFRNGNTVFLNQLRLPNKDNIGGELGYTFTNADLYEAAKQVSKDIMELSNDSTYPIDNVIIHKCMSVPESAEEVDLGIEDPREGMPYFYIDVSKKDVVLATRAKNESLVPINFNKTNLPVYETARDEVKVVTDIKKLNTYVNRIHSIKLMLEGKEYRYINPVVVEGIKYAEVNNDWYIYVDMNDEIHMEVIDVDLRAVMEAQRAKERIENERGGGSRGI